MCLRGSDCGRRGGPDGRKGAERRGSTREAAQAEDGKQKPQPPAHLTEGGRKPQPPDET